MKTKPTLPESLREAQRRAVQSRWSRTTPQERSASARKLWKARIAKHARLEAVKKSNQRKSHAVSQPLRTHRNVP
jgi:acyl-CoA reductase-like NAD-dependent aldehyde dehydrogenase